MAFLLIAAVVTSACGTSSTVSSGPDPVKCQVAVGTPPPMEAGGGAGAITVTALPECAWTATTSATWISGLAPTSGQGNGTVAFRAAANEGAGVREGAIVVNNEQARVSQRAPCRYTLTPATQNVPTTGGLATIAVGTSESDCAWNATKDAAWISLTGPTSGTGPGTITLQADANPNAGPERTATIVVGGQRATVVQTGASVNCSVSFSPTTFNIGAAGGTGVPITIAAETACSWVARSEVSWITLTSAPRGEGSGTVTFTVGVNAGTARTGTISIQDRTFTVTQAAAAAPACTFNLAPPSLNAPAAGSTGTITVTAGVGCSWTAVSNATAWLTVTSGAAGSANGSVGFSVAANTGALRTGAITIGTTTFAVTQAAAAAPCTYSIAPTSQNVAATASTGTVAVTAGSGCPWTATSTAPTWLTVTSGALGSGNGSVGFSVAANTGASRSGSITIANQTFTVTQAAAPTACSYTIAPTSSNFTALGGSGTVTVTTATGCPWTAASNAPPWLTVTSGSSGSGNGSVGFSVGINIAGARSGTLTIGGQTFTVTQNAVLLNEPSGQRGNATQVD